MEGYVNYTKDHNNHKLELKRLADQHDVLLDAMRGQGLVAPIDLTQPQMRFLDSGAADGRWLLDLRRSFGNGGGSGHHYFGTDVNPSLFPSSPPADVCFRQQSILEPFPPEWRGTFHVVHQRLVMAVVKPPATSIDSVVEEFAGLLRPEGWLQLVELDNDCVPENGPALRRLLQYHQQNSAAGGLGPNLSVHLAGAMRNAGLRHVEVRRVDVLYGARNTGGRELKEKSTQSLSDVVGPVLAQAKGMCNDVAGLLLD
ncbi:hypothetical protein LY78DRAFT_593987 [Colletotrichum sublineola]|uniref:Methyltransferase n=1 Tax=Colletotrichum sublineola TaxID=1173701 RepID=A0A066XN14_COLSU|nr:hypothetical protein LY78DRAFT_593987 [Colletotrichum sublineola]KDN70287.1 hypothetical protein CSUB01_11976 [Colletotrichum sublineola]